MKQNKPKKNLYTSSPEFILQKNGSLQSKIPVVSRSEPPRQVNPSRGASSFPSQSGAH